MTVSDIIKKFPAVLTANVPANVKKTIQYNISMPLYVVLDHGQCSVHDGVAPSFDLGLTIKDEHLLAMFKGELSAPYAYVTGKLKVQGDMLFAQKVPTFFDLTGLL